MSKKKSTQKLESMWDADLVAAPVETENWTPFVFVAHSKGDVSRSFVASGLQQLALGFRKKFMLLTKDNLTIWAKDIAKAKAKPKDPFGIMLTEACTQINNIIEEKEPITPDLFSRMVKARVLQIRTLQLEQRATEEKARQDAAEALKAAGGDRAKTPKTPGPGGKTPKPKATDKKKGGKDDPPSDDVGKRATVLKKRGEDLVTIDDEPFGGPDMFFCIDGFTDAKVFKGMDECGLALKAVLQVSCQADGGPSSDFFS